MKFKTNIFSTNIVTYTHVFIYTLQRYALQSMKKNKKQCYVICNIPLTSDYCLLKITSTTTLIIGFYFNYPLPPKISIPLISNHKACHIFPI